jgi:hydrogenase expression/formation protein HypC
MCLAIPGQIVEIADDANDIAKVDVAGVRRNINITLVRTEGTGVGDWVLIHVGFALSRINEQDAAETLRLLESLGDEFQQEQDGFNNSQIE